jgi:hypothetical protein
LTAGRTSILFSKMMKLAPKDSSGLSKLTACRATIMIAA